MGESLCLVEEASYREIALRRQCKVSNEKESWMWLVKAFPAHAHRAWLVDVEQILQLLDSVKANCVSRKRFTNLSFWDCVQSAMFVFHHFNAVVVAEIKPRKFARQDLLLDASTSGSEFLTIPSPKMHN